MRRQLAFLIVLVFGYSLILGDETTVVPDDTTTIETISNETLTNVTSEISNTTTPESTSSTSSSGSSPLSPTTVTPSGVPLSTQNNETTDYNTTDYNTTATPEGPLHNETGSPPTSSSLNTDPKAEKRDDGQRFDTASFVGGIILAVGVVALGFFLFKVYQSRKGPRAEYNNI